MDKIKKIAARSKEFVVDHKVGVAVVLTSAFWIKTMANTAKVHNDFLKEHGLYDEFYQTFED